MELFVNDFLSTISCNEQQSREFKCNKLTRSNFSDSCNLKGTGYQVSMLTNSEPECQSTPTQQVTEQSQEGRKDVG